MGKTYKKLPYKCHRSPKGRKKAIINKARNKAVPPDPWDDIMVDNQCYMPYQAAKNMVRDKYNFDEIVGRLVNKFHLSYLQALKIVDICWT